MKKIIYILFALMIIPTALAINVDVEKLSSNEVMIYGLNEPATFDLQVTNEGLNDEFSFYTFFGLGIEPREPISFKSGETKNITLKVYPRKDSDVRGFSTFSYFIQSKDSSEIEQKLMVQLIDLEDAFEIGTGAINPDSNQIQVYFNNKVNFNFDEVEFEITSPFFSLNGKTSLEAQEMKTFTVDLNKEDFNKLMAGFYTLKAEIKSKNITAEIEEKIVFEEKDILTTTSNEYGFVIATKKILKTNEGNLITDTETIIKKNILSRVFTSFSPEPTQIERQGASVYYTWTKNLSPGESFEIKVKTNWMIPFLIILLVIAIVIFSKKYAKTDITMRKRVSFVHAKGGEFALKVIVNVEANNYVEDVRIVDQLPPLVKVYNKFNGEVPKRFYKSQRKFEWEFDHLEKGERRVLTYIIYSKVGVLGRFALPSATAFFKENGKLKEASSNKAFFLAEQRGNKDFFE